MEKTDNSDLVCNPPQSSAPKLKKLAPYWHPYRTMAKQRWWGREILELVSTEFRDRSVEYYRFALQSGVTTINGKVALPGTIVRNGDRIENVVHRHEPPVTSTPVKVMHIDHENEFIVIDKPGSIPVHATGRYYKHSLIEILQSEFGFEKVYTVNRLDRLTSGCMIIATSPERAKLLCQEFLKGTVKKEYIARCAGEFPSEEVTVDQPMLTIDKQMGLNVVHPEGKPAKTIFNRLFYDSKTNTSVLHCRPLTGRSHQIRVHLQYIGYPIANDPVYSDKKVWGDKRGKGGLDIKPAEIDVREPPRPPPGLDLGVDIPSSPSPSPALTDPSGASTPTIPTPPSVPPPPPLLPRESGLDIGLSSPVPLSSEAVSVITKLRNMKDEGDDWARWRDVCFRAKAGLKFGPPSITGDAPAIAEPTPTPEILTSTLPLAPSAYCPDCYLPLHPDPPPEKLYIFLHALRYTTSQWSFETEMPFWAEEGWEWKR